VPPVDELWGEAANQQATVHWPRQEALQIQGTVVSYNVYRADELIGPYMQMNTAGLIPAVITTAESTEPDTTEEFLDRFLENGRTYYYIVRAVNAFGIESEPSPVVEITPQDTRTPLPPNDITVEPSGTGARLSWELHPRRDGITVEVHRSLKRDGTYQRVYPPADGVQTSREWWIDTDVIEGNEYYYYMVSVGPAGTRSGSSDTATFFYPDNTPPTPPQGVTAQADTGRITISWKANIEGDILGYEVERTGGDTAFATRFLLTSSPITETSFTDSISPRSQSTYGYVVYALDRSYNRSGASQMVRARMPDIVPPQVPIIVSATEENRRVMLRWTESPSKDFAGFRIYRDTKLDAYFDMIAEPQTAEYTDQLDSAGSYYYAVSAVDSAGNESQRSRTIKIQIEGSPPPPPTQVTVDTKEDHIVVRWQSGGGTTDGFVIDRIDDATGAIVRIAEPKVGITEFTDLYADTSKRYTYKVHARDNRWRLSPEASAQYPKK
jgi:fibronectin type 3 domain-containing protein